MHFRLYRFALNALTYITLTVLDFVQNVTTYIDCIDIYIAFDGMVWLESPQLLSD